MPRRPWTDDELNQARDMRAAGRFYSEIDKVLGRRAGTTQQRLEWESSGSGREVRQKFIPNRLLAERDALTAARNQRTLTQDFLGDPPPGYSALNGKTGQR
jgi:hypothetical protein